MTVQRPGDESARRQLAAVDMAAAASFGIPLSSLYGPGRGTRREAAARQAAVYLSRVALGLPTGLVAAHARRDRSTIAHACRVVEGRRDEPGLDAAITALERAIRRFWAGFGGEAS